MYFSDISLFESEKKNMISWTAKNDANLHIDQPQQQQIGKDNVGYKFPNNTWYE